MTELKNLFTYDGYFNIGAGRDFLIISEYDFTELKVFMFCGLRKYVDYQ